MPFKNIKSPFQANTVPPPARRNYSSLEDEFASMTIRPYVGTAIFSPYPQDALATDMSIIRAASSNRVHTSMYNLGDNTRSYLEGMMPISRTSKPAASRTFAAKTGTELRSIFTSQQDAKMATRQVHIESMELSERKEQESWAQSMIKRTASCPQKYAWARISGGYRCTDGHHHIPDDLLAEGNGGIMLLKETSNTEISYGPYYPDPNCAGQFLYCGRARCHTLHRSLLKRRVVATLQGLLSYVQASLGQ